VARVGEFPAAARRILPQDMLQRLRAQLGSEGFERPPSHVDPVAAEDPAQIVFSIPLLEF